MEKKYRITELTWEYHKNAERQAFVSQLLSGTIDEKLYATYLYNQLKCYSKLEQYALESSCFTSDISGSKMNKTPEYLPFKNNGLFVLIRNGMQAGEIIQIASAPIDLASII